MSTTFVGALLTVYLFLICSSDSQKYLPHGNMKLLFGHDVRVDCVECDKNSTAADLYTKITTTTRYPYPTLFRDHVYRNLTEMGKEMFYPVGIHPSCAKKQGYCIRRRDCIKKKMLYISSICYLKDLVCCYDNNIEYGDIEINPAMEEK